jgi:hypothetical protein
MARISFDIAVAMHGYATESKEVRKAEGGQGQISTRNDALRAIDKARADVFDMENERKRRA